MSAATTLAIVGSAVAGAAVSSSASRRAAKAANGATAASAEASAEQLAFSKEQYDDWKSVFGDVQDNLSGYYKHLTPDAAVASGVQNINKEYAQANTSITQSLAQRGISSSGLEGQALVDLATRQAQDTASLKTQAPQLVANAQSKFLSLGLNQGSQAVAGVENSYGNQALLATQQAGMYSKQASQSAAGLGSSISSGVNSYLTFNAMNNQNNLLKSALGGGAPAGFTNLYSGPTSTLSDTTPFVQY